jgi:ubiquinone/menaquinone biosynthesis C-methylase UbiE
VTAPSAELFFETMFAAHRAAALKAAIDLDVFSVIGDGAHTVAAIADGCLASARGIRILCDNLAIMGFLTKTAENYALTPDSTVFLSKRSPAYIGGAADFLHSPATAGAFARLAETIRLGTVAPEANNLSDNNAIWLTFARAMAPLMIPAANAIADLLQIESAGPIRVLDIAAGHGTFGIVIATRNPAAKIVAVDWTPVLAVATENAHASGVGDRYQALNGDAFTVDFGTEFDLALITNFLHHFDRHACVRLLRKTAWALKPGGTLAILDFVPNDDRVSPPLPASFSLTMLGTTPGGDAYTLREHQEMLEEAGFEEVTPHALPVMETIILASLVNRDRPAEIPDDH